MRKDWSRARAGKQKDCNLSHTSMPGAKGGLGTKDTLCRHWVCRDASFLQLAQTGEEVTTDTISPRR